MNSANFWPETKNLQLGVNLFSWSLMARGGHSIAVSILLMITIMVSSRTPRRTLSCWCCGELSHACFRLPTTGEDAVTSVQLTSLSTAAGARAELADLLRLRCQGWLLQSRSTDGCRDTGGGVCSAAWDISLNDDLLMAVRTHTSFISTVVMPWQS